MKTIRISLQIKQGQVNVIKDKVWRNTIHPTFTPKKSLSKSAHTSFCPTLSFMKLIPGMSKAVKIEQLKHAASIF